MKNQSFRSIITITLFLVVSTISFASFYIYSNYLEKRIYSGSKVDIVSALATLHLLKDQIYCTIEEHDGKIIDTILQRMDNHYNILNASLLDTDGEIKYSLRSDSLLIIPVLWDELGSSDEDVGITSFPSAKIPFSRAYIRLQNSPSCYKCHSSERENLGYVIIDMTLNEASSIKQFIHKSSLLFTLIMVVVIISSILFMHYKFVRKSLREFTDIIKSVNQGNLQLRLSIPETKELGRLGKNFNSMLDTFQNAQKELQEYHKKELRSKYKLATIGEMSARLAHEIRNPIMGIASAIEIIANNTKDEENKPILEEIQRQAQRVNDAISSLLNYSRKKELNLVMNDINDVILQVEFFLKNQVHLKEIEFILNLQPEIPHFRFDREQMEDVLLNLGLNAIQAIPKNGTIIISSFYSPHDKQVCIHVTDTGKGIPTDIISSIFHPFFTTRNEGTGLGLAIVKDAIDNHQGIIWAENIKEGGSVFKICLPINL